MGDHCTWVGLWVMKQLSSTIYHLTSTGGERIHQKRRDGSNPDEGRVGQLADTGFLNGIQPERRMKHGLRWPMEYDLPSDGWEIKQPHEEWSVHQKRWAGSNPDEGQSFNLQTLVNLWTAFWYWVPCTTHEDAFNKWKKKNCINRAAIKWEILFL